MRRVKEFEIIKQFLDEIKDVKRRLIRVESMLAEEYLTPKDWREIEKAREEIRKAIFTQYL